MTLSTEGNDAIVQTPFGRLRGTREGGVSAYHRVPYAEPPLGSLRFEAPVPVRPWQGLREASAPAPVPPQFPSRLEAVMGAYPAAQDEDCLHLDIWTPHEAGAKAPVLVFIHGGAFMTGGGSLSCYDGADLARKTGLVVVTITYRLGFLGFLPQDRVGVANPGLHDQILALRWLKEAVDAFGGDPDQITVSGQSAGAASIAIMLASPACKGLFHRAILMSAPFGVPLKTPDEAADVLRDALALAGLAPGDTAALKDLPLSTLMQTQLGLLKRPPPTPYDVAPPFMPVIDGVLLSQPLVPALVAAEPWCDVMIGFTREESAAFYAFNPAVAAMPESTITAAFQATYGEDGTQALQQARSRFLTPTATALMTDLGSDRDFIAGAYAYADSRRGAPRRTFLYRFDWAPPKAVLGACHCLDLPFLFGNLDVWGEAAMLRGADLAEMEALAARLQNQFAAFARSGDPNGPGLPLWPAYEAERAMLHIDRRTEAQARLS